MIAQILQSLTVQAALAANLTLKSQEHFFNHFDLIEKLKDELYRLKVIPKKPRRKTGKQKELGRNFVRTQCKS